ncbi:MAG: aldolase/citrate lyase family protein [Candidatus Bathyarchaeia archaeon]
MEGALMRKNPVKEKLRSGEAVIGAFCNIPSPAAVEILGLLGFDFAIIDAEHGIPDLETVEHMVRAAEAVGITPLVRIALNLQQNILRYLDAGAMGIQIPLVNSVAEAEAVVRSAKYPPMGRRGLAAVRAGGYGIGRPLGDYVKMANEETLVIVQVETVDAVRNAADIVKVEGIDAIFIGPTDLSSSMGYPGQPSHPDVVATIERVGRMAIAAGKAAGTIARDPAAYERWRRVGFQYLCTGVTNFLASAAEGYLKGCREREGALRAGR